VGVGKEGAPAFASRIKTEVNFKTSFVSPPLPRLEISNVNLRNSDPF
jgi:hypothetical protein